MSGRPWSSSHSLRLALSLIAAAAALLGLIELAFTRDDDVVLVRLATVLAAWVYTAAGVLAWSRRPSNRTGFLIAGGGLLLLVTGLDVTVDPVLISVSQIVATVPFAVLIHVLLAFPSGRLQTREARYVAVFGYFVCVVLQAPRYLFSPGTGLMMSDLPDLAEIGAVVQKVAGTMSVIATAIVLAARLRRADPARRRVMLPLYGYGMVGVLYIPLAPNVLEPLGLPHNVRLATQVFDLAGLAVAFTVSLLRGGFSRAGEIQELGTWLSTADSRNTPLVVAVRRALGDDTARLLFWSPELDSYVDENGVRTEPDLDRRRGLAVITGSGQRIGAIEYDTGLNADAELVEAAGHVVAVALDRERVSAELLASRQELLQSRVRIVEAADAERRRMARDLHDGLQVRLVLLAMQAEELANDQAVSQAVQEAARSLRLGLDSAAAESRGLVHAVLPAALIEGGLEAAVDDLVDHVPMSVALDVDISGAPLAAIIESTAYFVVAEALGNALKHAQPTALAVRVGRADGTLTVEVIDDGAGGAHFGGGSGLRGLNDRVEALGGTLSVTSDDGEGTRVRVELPDNAGG